MINGIMDILALDEDNKEMYKEFISEDVAENLDRNFFQGALVVEGQEPVAGLIWEYRKVMSEGEKESNIIWLRLDSPDASEMLFEYYKGVMDIEDVVLSTYALPALNFKEGKAALKAAGFAAELMEGNLIKTRLAEALALPFFKKVKLQDSVRPLSTITQRGFQP